MDDSYNSDNPHRSSEILTEMVRIDINCLDLLRLDVDFFFLNVDLIAWRSWVVSNFYMCLHIHCGLGTVILGMC